MKFEGRSVEKHPPIYSEILNTPICSIMTKVEKESWAFLHATTAIGIIIAVKNAAPLYPLNYINQLQIPFLCSSCV